MIKRGRAPCSRRVAHGTIVGELVRQMIGVGRGIIIRLMAREAVRWSACVLTIDMTRGAGNGLMGAGQREIGVVMVEGGWAPCRRRVAHGTIVGELVGQMIGISRSIIIRLMAREAVRWRSCILIIDMALAAVGFDMSAGQGEVGLIMVEGRWRPCHGSVAGLAFV